MPEHLVPPRVNPAVSFYLNAFLSLMSDRASGMAMGPITFVAVNEYAKRYRIEDLEEFEIFEKMIRKMDAIYLDYKSKQTGQDT